jgi:RNA polymerase sigma factor (sigma-70 family)
VSEHLSPKFSDDQDDRTLVAQIREGNQEAAEVLYRRYASRLMGLADRQMSRNVRRLAEPEDIVQSAFRSLFRGVNSGSYDAPEGCSLWQLLAVIAIHKVRKKIRRDKSVQPTAVLGVAAEYDQILDVAAPCTPEIMEVALQETLECLRPAERDVVVLRVQGFTVEEISDKLSRSRRTVERTLQQVRETLADQLVSEDDP